MGISRKILLCVGLSDNVEIEKIQNFTKKRNIERRNNRNRIDLIKSRIYITTEILIILVNVFRNDTAKKTTRTFVEISVTEENFITKI